MRLHKCVGSSRLLLTAASKSPKPVHPVSLGSAYLVVNCFWNGCMIFQRCVVFCDLSTPVRPSNAITPRVIDVGMIMQHC